MRSILTLPLRSRRPSPLPCYGRRIFSVTPQVAFAALQPTIATSNIFYYHTNHLGSTAFVTDQNQNITQGFLYAPFGEITTEYAPLWQNGTLPKYAFNAKELDEETGMYYYEARYYKPPVFTSRDPMFEKYFWMTPYAYYANNPVKYVDPDGEEIELNDDIVLKGQNNSSVTIKTDLVDINVDVSSLGVDFGTVSKNVNKLILETKELYGGNVTIMKNGEPLFRVHQPGTHGNKNATLTKFRQGVNPNNGRHFNIPDKKVSSFDKQSYDI